MDAPSLMRTLMPERASFVRLARSRVGTAADAEDVVQGALLRASARAASLEDPARARAWFYRILRHAIVDHRRTRGVEVRHAEHDVEPVDGATLETSSAPCACTVRLLADLRPAYAEILRRIDVEGEEPAAVAEALDISVGNVHVRLHRARHLLRDKLKHHCGVETLRPCLDCTCDARSRCHGTRERTEPPPA
jgi:DNA-directed RNA polymerase specialized sigma24 family protein